MCYFASCIRSIFLIIHTKLVSEEGIEIMYKAYLSNFCFNSCFDLRAKEEFCKFIVFLLGELKQDGKYTLSICLRDYRIELLRELNSSCILSVHRF